MTDEKLLVQQAQSDPAAFGLLYDKYFQQIYAFIYLQTRDEALTKDVVAAAFESALHNIHKFEWRGFSFGAWLYRIARNELGQQRRRQKWLAPWQQSGLGTALHTDGRALELRLQEKERLSQVQAALWQLSAKDRELITLRFWQELETEEVAQILGCSTQQVYVRLHRALKRLRQKMDALQIAERIGTNVAF